MKLSLLLVSLAGVAYAFKPEAPPKPSVTSSKLQKLIKLPNLLKHAKKLSDFAASNNGTRSFGSKGHNATLAYIKNLLDQTGYYHTEYQPFANTQTTWSAFFTSNNTGFVTSSFTYSPSGTVSAPLVLVSNLGCVATDFPPTVKGNLALIKRGDCEFGLKVALAGAAGASGALIYNNVVGAMGSSTLSVAERPTVGPYVPVGGLSDKEGEAFATLLTAGVQVEGTLQASRSINENWSSNLIATSKGGDQNNIVMAGSHTDSVPAGPGLNDNGSGTIGLLELALQLSNFKTKNAVRFGFWTAEEIGLVGSTYYVGQLSSEDKAKVALYLNFDMIASPNAGYFILDGSGNTYGQSGPPGSEHIQKTFENYFLTAPVRSTASAFTGRSDYGPFLTADIPAGGLQTGAEGIMTDEQAGWWGAQAGVAYDKCYHSACDTIDNLNTYAWVINTKGATHAIATYAKSLDGIPRGDERVKAAALRLKDVRPSAVAPIPKGEGCEAHLPQEVLSM